MAEAPIISEVSATDETVAAIKNEMQAQAAVAAVPGTPIDRIPYNAQLVALEASGVYTKRIAATDRCIRTVEVPQKGGTTVKFHCSRPCIGVGDQRLCPDHNRDFFQPNQSSTGPRPKSFNSASVPLTKGETDELARISKSFAAPPPASAPVAPQVTTEAAPEKLQHATAAATPDSIRVTFTLDELAGGNALAAFVDRATRALDELPCNSVRQMKQIVAIQEKIAKLAKRGKHDSATSTF